MSQEIQKDDKGCYSLCVFNAEDKSYEEIQEIFGKYGEIQQHKAANLLFLRYKSYEEAVACFKGFLNHPVYRVRPAKNKGTNNSGSQRREDVNHRTQDDKSGHGSSTRDSRSRNPNCVHGSNITSKLPPMPKLQPACKSPVRDSNKAKLEIAKGVVIGNLHSAIQQKDIYTLCSKAQAAPLQVDMKSFKPPHYRTIYYANVYVKTDSDVENIVNGLNNLTLKGHTLVVKSIEKTLAEADDDEELEEGRKLNNFHKK